MDKIARIISPPDSLVFPILSKAKKIEGLKLIFISDNFYCSTIKQIISPKNLDLKLFYLRKRKQSNK